MAGFGGSVKLTGADQYKSALKDITQNLKVMSAEMKATSSSFEAGEKSQQEIIQASKEMKKALDEQKQALVGLKAQLPDMVAKYEQAGKKHKELTGELEKEQKALDQIEKEFGQSSREYEAQKKVVDDLTKEVAKSGKEYDALGKDVDNTKIQIAKAETTINQTSIALDNMGKEAEESGNEAVKGSEGYTVMKNVLANLATEAITACIDGLKNMGAAIVDTISDVGTLGDEIDKESQKLGVSAETYQELSYALERNGASIDDVSRGIKNITNAIADTENGVAGASEKFDALGVSLQNADGSMKTSEQVLMESIDALASMTDETQRNAMANDIFGKSYQELAPLLNSGSEGIKSLMQEASDYGMVMGDDAVKASAAYKDSLTKLEGTMGGLKNNIAGAFLPAITDVINGFSDLMIGSDGASESIMTGINEMVNQFTAMIPQATSIITQIAGAILEVAPEIITSLIEGVLNALPLLAEALPKIGESILKTLSAVLPSILTTGTNLLKKLTEGIKTGIPSLVKMLPTIIKQTVSTLMSLLPEILTTGKDLLEALILGISDAIPELVSMLPEIITTIIDVLTSSLPQLVSMGVELVVSLINGIISATGKLAAEIPNLIKTIVKVLKENLPKILEMGGNIVKELIKGIVNLTATLGDAAYKIATTIWDKLKDLPEKMLEMGGNLVKGIWNGISNAVAWITEKIKGFGNSVKEAVKKAFGIASPSKVMRDEVGKYLAQGIAVGFEDEMKNVANRMNNAIPTEFGITSTGTSNVITAETAYASMVDAFKDALYQVKIEMDDVAMGKFVDKTMTSLVFS